MRRPCFKYIFSLLILIGFIWEVLATPVHLRVDVSDGLAHLYSRVLDTLVDADEKTLVSDSTLFDESALNLDSLLRIEETNVSKGISDSLKSKLDSATVDTTGVIDTLPPKIKKKRESFLKGPLKGSSKDSLLYDVQTKSIFQYGNGQVKYDEMDMELQAEKISFDVDSKIIRARGDLMDDPDFEMPIGPEPISDSTQKDTDTVEIPKVYKRPVFTQGDMVYDIDSIDYNIDTHVSYIMGVNTDDGEGYMYGEQIKKMPDDVIHMKHGRYTTCDHEHPHFYVHMTKGTTVPGKKTVFGPAYLVFEDVPLYFLGLPYGFFPQSGKRRSGIIFPSFGEETARGFFLRDGGYYFAISDMLDLAVTGGIYTLGSWHANASSNYKKRYKYSGSLNVDYASDVVGEKGATDYLDQRSFRFRWEHRQDSKASPGTTFSANVDFSTSGYNRYNGMTMNDRHTSQTSSSVSYARSWAGTPFSFSANANFSHDIVNNKYDFTLPTLTFNVAQVAPFKRKKAVGRERWYEKINFTYNTTFQNRTGAVHEDDLFKSKMFDQMNYSVSHRLPVKASFNLFQYLNITPSFNYNENWYFKKENREWNAERGSFEPVDTTNGFYRVYDYSLSASLNTKLYGTYTLGRKTEKMITFRHVMSPQISFSYRPGFAQYWNAAVGNRGVEYYSPYSIGGSVPQRESSASINFGIGNTLDMKVPSKRDTTGFKKIKLIEQLSISSSYNFMADSLKLAPFNVQLRTKLFPGSGLDLDLRATFDPYQIDENGDRINELQIKKGGLARLTSFSTGFGYSFSGGRGTAGGIGESGGIGNPRAINDPNSMRPPDPLLDEDNFFDQPASQVDLARRAAGQYYDFDIPWSFSFSYRIDYSKAKLQSKVTQYFDFSGNMNLTSKWGVSFNGAYDFETKKISTMSMQITRDLHCWQMNLSWIPIGYYKSWSFTIRANSSMLADVLKWDKRSSFYDNNYVY